MSILIPNDRTSSSSTASWMHKPRWLGSLDGHRQPQSQGKAQGHALSKTLEKKRASQDLLNKNGVPLKELLDLMLKLLKVHEVKMAMQLLSELMSLPLSNGNVAATKDELANVLHGLSAQSRSDAMEGLGDGATLFERYSSVWSATSRSTLNKATALNGIGASGNKDAQHSPPRSVHSPNSPAGRSSAPALPLSPKSSSAAVTASAPAAPQMDLPMQVKPPSHEPRRLMTPEERCDEADKSVELEHVYGPYGGSSVSEPELGANGLPSDGRQFRFHGNSLHSLDMHPIISEGNDQQPEPNMESEGKVNETIRSLEAEDEHSPLPSSHGKADESWGESELRPESEVHEVHFMTRNYSDASCQQANGKESMTSGAAPNRPSAANLQRRATVTQALLTQMTTRLSTKAEDLKLMMAKSNLNMKVNLKTTKTMDVLDETWLSLPSNRFIIHPNGTFRMSWDVFALVAIINEAILVPLSVFFEMETPELIMLLSTIFFSCDLFLNCFTGYFHDGMLIMKQKPILWNYIVGWFFLDLMSTFPWYAVFNSSSGTMLKFAKFGKMARVLRLLRIAKLNMLVTRIEEFLAGAVIAITLSLMKIVAFLGLLCHWCACIWGWLGDPMRCEGCTSYPVDVCEPGGPCESGIQGTPWRTRYGVYEFTLLDQYLLALRFAVGLVTGSETDIQPGFWAERTFVCVMTFCSFILCSTVISQIIVTFHKILQEQSEQLELMRNFKEFMSAGRVPFPLQAKVRRYLEFQFKSRKDLQMRRFDLLERLSPWLRAELLVHMNKPVLTQHAFFKQLPHTILAHICCLAESMTCAPGDILAEPGQNLGKMYFLVRGKLHIKFPEAWGYRIDAGKMDKDYDADNPGFLLHPPGFVCASNLMMKEVHSYCITSAAHSEVVIITRNDLETLVGEFPSLQGFIDKAEKAVEENRFQDSSMKELQSVMRNRSQFGTVGSIASTGSNLNTGKLKNVSIGD